MKRRWLRIGLGFLAVAGVWATSLYSYLLFHTLVELFAIVVAGAVFMLAWNTRPQLDDSFLPWVGASVLAASLIDLVHTLAYRGMNVFVGYDANLPTQLWIAARGLQAACLLVAPALLGRRVRLRPLAIALAGLTVLLIAAPLARVFPDCYIEGQGLTPFKIHAEYVISGTLVAATVHLWVKRRWLAPRTLHLLVAMNLLTVGAELFFTLYVGVYDLSNALGHLFKVASYAVLYAALVETGLRRPHELLWRQLTESESALRESERRYRLLFETMSDGFALCDMPSTDETGPACRLLEMNPAFERITGLSRDDLRHSLSETMPHLEPSWDDLLQRAADDRARGRVLAHDLDRQRWIEVAVSQPTQDQLAILLQDVTERRKIEHDLRRTRVSIDRASDLLLWLDPSGTIVDANASAFQRLGYEAQDLLGMAVTDVLRHDGETPGSTQTMDHLRQERAVVTPGVVVSRDGSEIPAEITHNYVKFGDREFDCAFVHDISGRLALQRELQEAETMEAIGRLAGGMAHEFNNLVTVINGYGEIIADALPSTSPLRADMAEVLAAGTRAAEITHQLLAFSRKQMLSVAAVDLNGLIRRMTPELLEMLGPDTQVRLDLGDRVGTIQADARQMEHVLTTMAGNARDAMPDGGRLHISTKRRHVREPATEALRLAQGDYVVLSVADTGRGMDEDTLDHLFQPFFTTKSMAEGTGLDLAMVHGTIKQFGGAITVDSAPGKGTLFRIYLPCE